MVTDPSAATSSLSRVAEPCVHAATEAKAAVAVAPRKPRRVIKDVIVVNLSSVG